MNTHHPLNDYPLPPAPAGATWGGRKAQDLKAAVLIEYGTRCHLCGLPGATTPDHIIPRSKGGTNDIANLRPAHASCNYSRGNKSLEEFRTVPTVNGERFFN